MTRVAPGASALAWTRGRTATDPVDGAVVVDRTATVVVGAPGVVDDGAAVVAIVVEAVVVVVLVVAGAEVVADTVTVT